MRVPLLLQEAGLSPSHGALSLSIPACPNQRWPPSPYPGHEARAPRRD